MKPLIQNYGELSNYMMEWIRSWLNPQVQNLKCYVTCPYLGPLLRAHLIDEGHDSLEGYIGFIHDKYGALPSQDFNTLIIPYTCGKHWSLYVVGELGFYHFDSLVDAGFHSERDFPLSLAKLWAIWRGFTDDADMWVGVHSSHA